MAASHLYRDGRYVLGTTGKSKSPGQMVALLKSWVAHYPVFSIEDGLAEDDWEGWRKLTHALGSRYQLIGDDLFATNPDRLYKLR